MENIDNLYKYTGKCDYQQQWKATTQAAIVSNPEGFNKNIPIYVGIPVTMNNPSARNFLSIFSSLLDSFT